MTKVFENFVDARVEQLTRGRFLLDMGGDTFAVCTEQKDAISLRTPPPNDFAGSAEDYIKSLGESSVPWSEVPRDDDRTSWWFDDTKITAENVEAAYTEAEEAVQDAKHFGDRDGVRCWRDHQQKLLGKMKTEQRNTLLDDYDGCYHESAAAEEARKKARAAKKKTNDSR